MASFSGELGIYSQDTFDRLRREIGKLCSTYGIEKMAVVVSVRNNATVKPKTRIYGVAKKIDAIRGDLERDVVLLSGLYSISDVEVWLRA
jgi:hypothetical protein